MIEAVLSRFSIDCTGPVSSRCIPCSFQFLFGVFFVPVEKDLRWLPFQRLLIISIIGGNQTAITRPTHTILISVKQA